MEGLPEALTAPVTPLPFAYISTGEETVFINTLDPQPRSRPIFTFHRPETLREWLTADTLDAWLQKSGGFYTGADDTKPSTPRARRKLILDLRQKFEQIVDEVSKDDLIPEHTGYSPEARQKAEALVKSFESYLAEHKDEIEALQFFYSVPHKKRLHFKDIQALANAISSPPRSWTTEKIWRAYETLEKSKVRGASGQRLARLEGLVPRALRRSHQSHVRRSLCRIPRRPAHLILDCA